MKGAALCPASDVLAAFVEGALDEGTRSTLSGHVRGCVDCSAVLDAILEETALKSGSGQGVPRDALRRALLGEGADEELPKGARVGRYEILGRLGAGAMGTVYAAHDPSLDRKVALKLIRAQVAGPELETRLLREAKAMARLSHPEVITVHDAGRDGERLFIAMELVDGGTLRQWLAERPRSWREILAVYTKAGRGLEQAHASGLVHRDFKPDNVLIGKDGRVRVTDFGLARGLEADAPESTRDVAAGRGAAEATLTQTGALVGTPAYMAPEQLAGKKADARSDVYAFCVALYEALYGQRPFGGETLADLRDRKLAGTLRPAPPKRSVPQGLRRALLRGMEARPEDRHVSMGALLDALASAARWQRAPLMAGGVAIAIAAAALTVRAARPAARVAPVSATIPAPECTTNRACIDGHGGAPFVCRASDQRCVPIASEDCTPMFEPQDLVAEDTVWLGAMFPVKGPPTGAYGPMNMEGAEFARREIAQATRSLDGSNASLRVRRVALVGCDDGADPMRAAKHLVDDVGVPGILGFRSGQEIVDVAGSFLIDRGVVTVASLSSSPLITRLPQPPQLPRMVWRTTFSLDLVAKATAKIIEAALEPRAGGGTTRVTLAREDMAAPLSFAGAFFEHLRFNGKPALESGHDYQEVTLRPGSSPAEIQRAADQIAQTSPTFVVLLGDPAITAPLVMAVEARTSPRKPTYIVAASPTEPFASFLGSSPDRRRRFYSVSSESSSLANARFVTRYNQGHAEKVDRTLNPGSSYDAFYMLAYAVFALGNERPTGVRLARAFERLGPPGPAIEAGPSQVFEAISALSAGKSIALEGCSSHDFDPATGESTPDIELLCAGVGPDGRASGEDVSSGIVYRAERGAVEGTLRCP